MRIRFKEAFRDEFPKEEYEVIGVSTDMNFFKVINEQGEGDWCAYYMIEDVEKYMFGLDLGGENNERN